MNFITTLFMTKLSTGQLLKGAERIDVIRKLNDNNSDRELINFIDKDTFDYIYNCYELYCSLFHSTGLPSLNIDMGTLAILFIKGIANNTGNNSLTHHLHTYTQYTKC